MTFLLDVNVLIALLDPDHVHHDTAFAWFERTGSRDWATCPIVENGVIRILGAEGYVTLPIGCADVAALFAEWRKMPGHTFWPDSISLIGCASIDQSKLKSPHRLTDIYLLALAVNNGGKLATLDRRLSSEAVAGGSRALHLLA